MKAEEERRPPVCAESPSTTTLPPRRSKRLFFSEPPLLPLRPLGAYKLGLAQLFICDIYLLSFYC